MKVAFGAPIGVDRLWALPDWLAYINDQTLKPSVLCAVISPGDTASRARLQHPFPTELCTTRLPFYPRTARNDDAADPHRAKHFSLLRNQLRGAFLKTDADVFVSVDTDIMLQDSTVIEQLVATLAEGWDVACALTYLHSAGEASHCYNAGFWRAGDPGAFDRIWERATEDQVRSHKPPIRIDIPMACFAIRRHAFAMTKYRPHAQGEDCGFADALSQHGFRVAWRTDVEARHVWNENELSKLVTA
jgi:hypothetical protein